MCTILYSGLGDRVSPCIRWSQYLRRILSLIYNFGSLTELSCDIIYDVNLIGEAATQTFAPGGKDPSAATGRINETLRQFASFSDISQGSEATHLRCGGIITDGIIANFLLILTLKKISKIG